MTRTKKIFVGGLSVNTTVEDVKQYFEQFGKVGQNWGCLLGLSRIGALQNWSVASGVQPGRSSSWKR